MSTRPIITLTTDFGLNDHFVGTVKGVILNIAPDAEIIDISHAVDAYDVIEGALTIAQAYSYFPAGTIHVVVVDPGVGTTRRSIAVTTGQHQFVAPDNGVLSQIYSREERVSVRHVTAAHYFLQPMSRTFHARDVFAPIAGYLAKGVALAKLGDEISDFVRVDIPRPKVASENVMRGAVLKVDHFGNLITNFTPQIIPSLFQAQVPQFKILAGQREITSMKETYGLAAAGEIFGILGSMGYLEICANQASAAQLLGIGKGATVDVVLS